MAKAKKSTAKEKTTAELKPVVEEKPLEKELVEEKESVEENKPVIAKKQLSKKGKIIISSVIIVVLLTGIVLGVILANIKRYSMRFQKEFLFNDHTQMIELSIDEINHIPTGEFHSNGIKVVRTVDNKYGLYSYAKNTMIIAPGYSSITSIRNDYTNTPRDTKSGKSYFRLNNESQPNRIKIVDENGQDLGLFRYDENSGKTYTKIKSRDIDYSKDKDSVKANINNRFKDEEVAVRDIKFGKTYKYDNLYFYEVWNITTTDDIVYENLYQITKDGHKLIQTINTETGISLEKTDLNILFLSNGNPIFVGNRTQTFDGEIINLQTSIYDINFNLKGVSNISTELHQYMIAEFRVGNTILSQYKIPTTDNKYDLSETDSAGDTKYYRIETYKLSLNNGSFNQITFDYLINNYYDEFNLETVLINASKIEDKKTHDANNYIINERLQFKEIDYEFNYITKIKDDRYIASLNNNSNFNLIDKNYNLISHFENCSQVLATEDTIIASVDGYYYMCNTDGVIVKKYSMPNIIYIRDDKYYIRKEEKVVNNKTTVEYYLEELGLSQESPLYTYSTSEKYTFNGQTYDHIVLTNLDELTLLTTIKLEGTTYTYSIYTIDGKLLKTLTGISTNVYSPELLYADTNNAVVFINNVKYTIDR